MNKPKRALIHTFKSKKSENSSFHGSILQAKAQSKKQYESATTIQRVIRGLRGRELAKIQRIRNQQIISLHPKIRQKGSLQEVACKRVRRNAAVSIQRILRGVLGRKIALETTWKKLGVAPNAYALKLMRIRSKEIETHENWTEMFDPMTNSFWYLNKAENREDGLLYTCWEAPTPHFESQLVCYLRCSNDSQKLCGKSFKNRNEFNRHRICDHAWECKSCESTNTGITYPNCVVCGNSKGIHGENLIDHLKEDKEKMFDLFSRKIAETEEDNEMDSGMEDMGDYNMSYLQGPSNLEPNQRLLVCRAFKAGICSLTTCPFAHPGIRDSATEHKVKDRPFDFFVLVCPEAVSAQVQNKQKCCHGNCSLKEMCKKYHPYVRPSTETLIRTIYPKRNGKFRKVHSSGMVIDGNVINHIFEGKADITWPTGDSYSGQLHNDLREGEGIWRGVESEYVGNWREGLREGWGIAKYRSKDGLGQEENSSNSSSSIYTGEWKQGRMHGIGRLQSTCGDIYEGHFKNGKYDGFGVLRRRNGDFFIGYSLCGKASGMGYVSSSTEVYKGSFKDNKKDGKGVCNYVDKSRYVGHYKEGMYEGYGTLTTANGKYTGEFQKGMKHGKGIIHFTNGDIFEGYFQKDKAKGMGLYNYACGEKKFYHGWHSNDKRNGKGTLAWTNGSIYKGEWLDNYFHGNGNLVWKNKNNNTTYSGSFVGGKKHGFGILIWEDGSKYSGEFEENRFSGIGKLKQATKNGFHVYNGQFKSGMKDGIGELLYANGNKYSGSFLKNMRDGKGKLTIYPDNPLLEEIYEGEWLQNQKEGIGTYIYRKSIGAVYEGYWHSDKRHGRGRLKFSSGAIYTGEFQEGKQTGKGVLLSPEGDVYDGEFVDGMKDGYGVLKESNGNTYKGNFKSNMRNGSGLLILKNGDRLDGQWHSDEITGEGVYHIHSSSKEKSSVCSVRVLGF